MINIFHLIALILCCNRIKEVQEQRRINDMIEEERRMMREWRTKKSVNEKVNQKD